MIMVNFITEDLAFNENEHNDKKAWGDNSELPYVSIVIPVLNGGSFISNCLESLLNLDFPENNFEIIVVDNGSTDRTVEVIRTYQSKNPQIKLYFEKIKSSYAARNAGIKKAKGQIIAFTDVDCIVDKNWLFNIMKGFNESSVGGIAGDILPASEGSLVERYIAKINILSQKGTMNSEFLPYPQTANAAYKKEVFDKIGFFDDKLISGGDADIAWRMQLETHYELILAPDATVFHKHRTDLKGLFNQQFKHGYGKELLFKKYRKFNSKQKQNNIKSKIFYYIDKILSFAGQIKLFLVTSMSKNADNLLLFEPLLALVSLCGFMLGRIYGSITLKNFLPGK